MKMNTNTAKHSEEEVVEHVRALMHRGGSGIAQAYSDLRTGPALSTSLIFLFHDRVATGPRSEVPSTYGEMFPELETKLRTPPHDGIAYVVLPFGGSEGVLRGRRRGVL